MAKLDDEFLQQQISALLAHEVAHQFGFSEEVAVKVQKAVFNGALQAPGLFSYVGVNLWISDSTAEEKSTDSDGLIRIKGSDAEALYNELKVEAKFSNGSEYLPPLWLKIGKQYVCAKFKSPLDKNSTYAQELERLEMKTVRTFDYVCDLNIQKNSGTVLEK